MKYVPKFFSTFLIISFIFGNFSLSALANKKDDINFQQSKTVDSGFEKIAEARKDYVKDEILIKYKNNKIDLNTSSGRTVALNFNSSKSLETKESLAENNISVLKIKDDKTVEEKILELKNDSSVEYAEPNYRRYPAVINSNDTSKGLLWGLDNTGQAVNSTSGTNDADIDGPEAWTISEATTSAPIIVAVIDTGIAYNHPDLITNMWDGTTCKDESGGALGSCNYGYDYEDGDKTPLPTTSAHGTHIAGIIGAVKNNNTGVIGVAQNVKIMAIKFGFDVASEIKSIDFAIQNGAKIINASFVGTSFSQLEYDAINRFRSAGGIFVAAAGNESTNNESTHYYPSDYNLDNIISVTATDQNDALASFSNYGVTSIDVGAPGTNIYSTISQETIALSEDFEEITPPAVPNGWVKGEANNDWATYALGGAWGNVLYGDLAYPYANNASTTITSPEYDLSTGGANIDFWTKCDTEYITNGWADYMVLEFSSDGGNNFTQVLQWDEAAIDSDTNPSGGAIYHVENLSIPSQYSTSNFKFRLRWVTNSSDNNYDGCLVDDIEITKFSDGSNEQYGYLDGTSMATPYVTGLAALIEGYNSGLTYSQVKNTILTTGDDKVSLSGKTVSGKRINAYSALLSIMASSSAKAINSFTIPSQVGTTTINETDHTILLTMPYGTVVTALVPTITTTGLSVSPASGVAHNFTATSTYTVTAGDATTQAYVVTVLVATPSNITTITSATYTIDNASSTITNIPYGTASSTFLSNLTKGESHQTWNTDNISSPVLSDDTLVVTAEDGTTTVTYTITVNAPSSDATLENLTISNDTLSPSFSTSTTAYTVSVSNSVSSVTVTPTQNEPHSTIKVNSATTTSDSASAPISLIVGSNSISIEVIAEDNTSTNTYTITVTRAVASSGGGGGGGGGSAPTIPVVTKKGDANGDSKIDKYDFSLMMSNWGKTGSNVCDFNSDGKVDKYDFSLLMLNWNK